MSKRMKKMEIKLPKIPNLDELIKLLGDAGGNALETIGGHIGTGVSKTTDFARNFMHWDIGNTVENYALKNRYDRLTKDPRTKWAVINALRGSEDMISYHRPLPTGGDFYSPENIAQLSWTRQRMSPEQRKLFDSAMQMTTPTKNDFKTRQAEIIRDLARNAESQLGNVSAYTGNLSSRQKKTLGGAALAGAGLGLTAGINDAINRQNKNQFASGVRKKASVKKKHKYM